MKFSRGEAINKIINMIDESRDPWRKAGFYGDPEVQRIMDSLYARWNENNREGIPLNYATDEELVILVEKAEYYSKQPASSIQRQLFFSENSAGKRGKREGLAKKLKRIFGLS